MGKLDFLKGTNWTRLALAIASAAPAVIDRIQRIKGATPGPEKADAAVDALSTLVQGLETVAGRNLLNDKEVLDAARALIAANVHLKNVIARKTAAALEAGPGAIGDAGIDDLI